jgi:hypothetical protein
MVSEWKEIAEAGVAYYSALFAFKRKLDPALLRETLSAWSVRIMVEEKSAMDTPMSLSEVTENTKKMKKNRAPGPDGAPIEFYLLQWDQLGPLVVDALNKGIQKGELVPKFTAGCIIVIPKSGSQEDFTNKRPITVLNTP